MPASLNDAIAFLETQWSSINDNKMKGILAEQKLKQFLLDNHHHFVSGGWILTPGNHSITPIPTREKLCLLPRRHAFSWQYQRSNQNVLTPAEISAYNYFRHVGVRALLVEPVDINEGNFVLPTASRGNVRAIYPRPYPLKLCEVSPVGELVEVVADNVFRRFPRRSGNVGMRCYQGNIQDRGGPPWSSPDVVSDLFWFEYARYYFQISLTMTLICL